MRWLLCLMFIVHVKTPFGYERTYKDIVSYKVDNMAIILTRENGKTIVVPTFFTLIEEK